jgi:23S rRNA pseudouridine1911/1915/1917 synthase
VVVPPPQPVRPEAQAMDLEVVFEDAHLIIVDKPAGLVVHPAPGHADGTLVNGLLAHCRDSLSGIGGVSRPGIVHRLDKDTSGLLAAAKTDAAHHALAEQFAAHTIERAYQAVVWGVPRRRRGEISGNIGRSRANRKKMAVLAAGGKPALTRYRVVRPLGRQAALMECRLATGRTHQIRVHMADLGHPIVGDPVYGGRRRGAQAAARAGAFGRQALHAHILGFVHPATRTTLRFCSRLPCDIKALIEYLEAL